MSNANFFYRQSYSFTGSHILNGDGDSANSIHRLHDVSSIYPSVPSLLYLWRRHVSSIALLSVLAICLMTLTPNLIHSLEYIDCYDDCFTQAAPVLPTQSKKVPPDRDPLYF